MGAGAVLLLFGAGRMVKVCGGAAYIVNITLEIRIGCDEPGLLQDRLLTAGGDIAALVQGQSAEVAGTETASVVDDGEPHLFDGGNAAQFLVIGVIIPGIGQGEHFVQFLAFQREGRGILNQIAAAGGLDERAATGEVIFVLLDEGRLGIGLLVLPHGLKGRQGQGVFKAALLGAFGQKAGAAHVPDLADGYALFQLLGDLGHAALAHAVGQQIGAAVLQNGAADGVIPVIVMGKPAQAGLDAADDDGGAGESLPRPVGIDDDRPVGPLAGHTAGGVAVLGPAALGHRVMGHHGVDVARIDEHAVAGLTHGKKIVSIVPVGLGQDGHPEAGLFQRPGNDRRAEGGMIHIGIAGNQQKIIIIPAPGDHILPVDRQKLFTCVHKTPPLSHLTDPVFWPFVPASRTW